MSGICVWLGRRHRGARGALGRQKEGVPSQNAPSRPPPAGSPRAGGFGWVRGWVGRKLRHGWRWGPASPSSAPQLHPLHPSHRLCPLGSCSPEALQGTTVTAVRIRPRAAGNGLAGVRRRRRRKGRLRTAKAQTTALGALRGTGQPPPVLRAGVGWLPTCCQPGLILHPAPSDEPRSPLPPPTPSAPQLGCDWSLRCPAPSWLAWRSSPPPARLHPAPRWIRPCSQHGARLHYTLGASWEKGAFFPTLGKRRDFRGSL